MKIKSFTLTALSALLLVSCSKPEQSAQNTVPDEVLKATNEELQQAVVDRDELLSLVSQINDDVVKIKEIEGIISVNTGETPNRRSQLINDMEAIKTSLAEKQNRLAELESRLKTSNLYNAQLQKTVESLKAQIETQNAQIASLNEQLGQANELIRQQSAQIDTLNSTVSERNTQLAASEQTNVDLTNDLNRCYYVIGSEKELKEQKIIEKAFLRKTKILPGDFNQKYFTSADKRNLTQIPLYSKKAEVMTNQPKDSYEFVEDANGLKTLKITNIDKFWNVSNYLVVKVK